MDVVKGLYEVAKQRKETKQEGSYTCYAERNAVK